MGCFARVAVPCPECLRPIEFQSKGQEWGNYTLANAPWEVLQDVNRHSPVACTHCGTPVEIKFIPVAVRAT